MKWKELFGPQTCPRWNIFILRLQIAIIFFFATSTKIQPDWLRCEPWKTYILAFYRKKPLVRWTLDFLLSPLSPDTAIRYYSIFISYGGIFYDGIIIPVLIYLVYRPIVILFLFLLMFMFFFNFFLYLFRVGLKIIKVFLFLYLFLVHQRYFIHQMHI